jgi:hypothetical protein
MNDEEKMEKKDMWANLKDSILEFTSKGRGKSLKTLAQ